MWHIAGRNNLIKPTLLETRVKGIATEDCVTAEVAICYIYIYHSAKINELKLRIRYISKAWKGFEGRKWLCGDSAWRGDNVVDILRSTSTKFFKKYNTCYFNWYGHVGISEIWRWPSNQPVKKNFWIISYDTYRLCCFWVLEFCIYPRLHFVRWNLMVQFTHSI